MNTPLEKEVARRFGVVPNYFRPGSGDPKIAENLWGITQFAYLDNALPSLFKERLVVYLSRFCEIRYCVARHVGFLTGLGFPAGDSSCLPQTVEFILPLLRRPLARGEDLLPILAYCDQFATPRGSFPEPESVGENALIACATHVFLQTADASTAQEALGNILGPAGFEQLSILLVFVRTAHYWTRLHPEIVPEDDVKQLLGTNETLAECIFKDPEAGTDGLSRQAAAELVSLRKIRQQHKHVTQAYQELSADHRNLYESEQNLREVVSDMPVAIYALDIDGRITCYNSKAVELWGRTPELKASPWVFLNWLRIFNPDGSRILPEDAPVRAVLATGVPVTNRELILERPDFSRVNALANISALRDSSGAISGAVSIFQDISELKCVQEDREALRRELAWSNKELSRFSYAVSHHLRAPVRGVRALTKLLLRRENNLQAESARLLTLIEQSTVAVESLVESLLRYAQAGHGHLARRRIPAGEVVESVTAALAPLLAETGGQIVSEPLPSVEADPVLLEQLFRNLISNALQYRRPGVAPVVQISASQSGERWEFAIKDNGQGIPADSHTYVFEPLKRLHHNDTRGTGLGLALSRTIITRHGGRIWVESEGVGRGAIFRFTLPAVEASPIARGTAS